MRTYDERALLVRLDRLDRWGKTAFATACAQRLFPLYERYARSAQTPAKARRFAEILSCTWDITSGRVENVRPLQSEAESMAPPEDGTFGADSGYGEHAAAALAYAIRTWITDDPQEAAWAARQVYDVADYAFWQALPGLQFNNRAREDDAVNSGFVQAALSAVDRYLLTAESSPSSWLQLRQGAGIEGRIWAATFP